MLMGAQSLPGATSVVVGDVELYTQRTSRHPVELASDVAVGAMQIDVLFDSTKFDINPPANRYQSADLQLRTHLIDDGVLRVVAYRRGGGAFSNGGLFAMPLTTKAGVQDNEPIVLANLSLAGPDGTGLSGSILPTVRLARLRNGQSVNGRLGLDLALSFPADNIARVTYEWGANLLGASTDAPFRVLWSPETSGPYEVLVTAYDDGDNVVGSRLLQLDVTHVGTFDGAIKGTYVGLLKDLPATHALSGYLTMTSSTSGAYTFRLSMGGRNYSAAGKFDSNGVATAKLNRPKPLAPLTVTLTQSTDPDVDQIVGFITDGAVSGPSVDKETFITNFEVNRQGWNAKLNPAPQAGRFTVLIPPGVDAEFEGAPSGDGYATLTVNTAGSAVLSGRLSDGTSLVRSTLVSKDGRLPLYASLYGNAGMASGWFTFQEFGGISDGDALLDWIRPTNTRAKQFADGFVTQALLQASRYRAPLRNARVIALANLGGNLGITAEGGGLLSPLQRVATVSGANAVNVPLQGAEKLSLRFVPSTGLLSGRFVHPNTGLTTTFLGNVFQKQNLAGGYFLAGAFGGGVSLTPNEQWTLVPEDGLPLGVSTLPVVAIRSPRAEQVLPIGTTEIVVSGTASDRNGIDHVECHYLHNGVLSAPETASGTTAWSYSIPLVSGDGGRFTIFAKSLDASGEQSNVATQSFRVMQAKDLVVSVSGPGRVSTGFLGTTQREVGRLYTITATPSSRKKFVGWTGAISSTARSVSFIMEEGFNLQANFSE